jgi:hypothetical protein
MELWGCHLMSSNQAREAITWEGIVEGSYENHTYEAPVYKVCQKSVQPVERDPSPASNSSRAGTKEVRSLTGCSPLPKVTSGQVVPSNRSSCRLGPARKGETTPQTLNGGPGVLVNHPELCRAGQFGKGVSRAKDSSSLCLMAHAVDWQCSLLRNTKYIN